MTVALRQMVHRRISHAAGGRKVTLRRRHSLSRRAGGLDPELKLGAAVSETDTSITITGTKLSEEGRVPKGITLDIAGDAQQYTASAAARVDGGSVTVGITPAAAQASLINAVVAIGDYVDYSFVTMRSEFLEASSREQIQGGERRFALSAVGAQVTPERGDMLFEGSTNDDQQRIGRVRTIGPAEAAIGYIVTVGE